MPLRSRLFHEIALHDFLCTTNANKSMATEVFMDDVIQQTDPTTFKKLLQNMRGGSMDDDDINLIFGKVL